MTVRRARADDAPRLAELHATRMTEGFLSALGPKFLRILYRRVVASPDAFAFVDDDCGDSHAGDGGSGAVVGFAAGALDVGDLYRSFVLHDGLVAGLAAAPRLLGSWRRVLETLRYPGGTDDLPAAEILSVAVDPAAAGRGVGTRVVGAATAELACRGAPAVKVVTAVDNLPALRLYERCGFTAATRISVHEGTASQVLVWRSS